MGRETHRFGPPCAPLVLVFAPGDGGPPVDPLLEALGHALAGQGVLTLGFEAPKGAPQSRDERWRDEIVQRCAGLEKPQRLILGGYSRGARIAAGLAAQLGARAFLGFGYPLHGVRESKCPVRMEALAQLGIPALICQGERDAHGNRSQVQGYDLPKHLQWHWMPGLKHALWRDERLLPQVAAALEPACRFVAGHMPADEDGG